MIRNGVDLPRYRPTPRDEDLAARWGLSGKVVFGYAGTHGMAHGLGNLLDAAERLRDRDDIRFLLVGDGAERAMLVAEVWRRGLDTVVLQPAQPKGEMVRVWSLCDVALIHLRDAPEFAEVIPSKMFEAMAMGLPLLLALPDGEAAAILRGHEAGWWVPPADPVALAALVRRLADDPTERRRRAAASLAAAPLHSRHRQAEEMIQLLEIVAAGYGDRAGAAPDGTAP